MSDLIILSPALREKSAKNSHVRSKIFFTTLDMQLKIITGYYHQIKAILIIIITTGHYQFEACTMAKAYFAVGLN